MLAHRPPIARALLGCAVTIAIALIVVAPCGCHHDWDALRYEDTPEGLCARLCAGYDFCVEAKPLACEQVCEANLLGCSGMEKVEIGLCADDVDPSACRIDTKAQWDDCVASIACFAYP